MTLFLASLLLRNFVVQSGTETYCTKFSNEKCMDFLTVNLYQILHASTYGIYEYMVKIKNLPRLVRGHQPPRASAARFALARFIVTCCRKERKERKAIII